MQDGAASVPVSMLVVARVALVSLLWLLERDFWKEAVAGIMALTGLREVRTCSLALIHSSCCILEGVERVSGDANLLLI